MSRTKEIDRKFIFEVIGLIAVVFSLVFVALEIQQNSLLMRAQIRDSIAEKQVSFFSMSGGSLETSVVVSKALIENGELNFAERQLFSHWLSAAFRMWENEWYQFENGLFEESEFLSRIETWRGLLNIPIARNLWSNLSRSFSPSFVTQMNSLIIDQ